jgi:aminoacyl-tRNA hydrolase
VLLKGSNTADHLYRILLARIQEVACWRPRCNRNRFCDSCDLLHVPSESGAAAGASLELGEAGAGAPPGEAPAHVIVGLGNPGPRYAATPHNVGQDVVDRLAGELGVTWTPEADALVARGAWNGASVRLVKPMAFMNLSGPVLARLARRWGIDHARCILVYDDHDLPLGAVRTRMRGSDGGHRGVRSILEAFQTDEFRRVKLGVRSEGRPRAAGDAVLAPFTDAEAAVIAHASTHALTQLAELVALGGDRPVGA